MALVLAPEPPLPAWLAALDAQIGRAPGFFEGRPVLIDLGGLAPEQEGVGALLQALADRGVRIIGTEGAHKSWDGVARWGGSLGPPPPPGGAPARAGRAVEVPDPPRPVAPGAAPGLLIDRAVRSGQQIVHEAGDVTVLGAVAWGAEIIAGGSIHIYGALRGRAIAGLGGNRAARIFCRRLEAELLAIDGVYRIAEDLDPALAGRPAQAWLEGESMLLGPLD